MAYDFLLQIGLTIWQPAGQALPRSETRIRAMGYLKGLLSSCERKNGWQLAEWLGNPTPDGVQYLLECGRWDPDAARDELQHWVADHLGAEEGIFTVDETGFIETANTRRVYSASTVEPPGGSRAARSAFFCATPALAAAPSSTMSRLAPAHHPGAAAHALLAVMRQAAQKKPSGTYRVHAPRAAQIADPAGVAGHGIHGALLHGSEWRRSHQYRTWQYYCRQQQASWGL